MTVNYLNKQQMQQLVKLLPTIHSLEPVFDILNSRSKANFHDIKETLHSVLKDFLSEENQKEDEINEYYNNIMNEKGFQTYWSVTNKDLTLEQIKQLFKKKHTLVKSISYASVVKNFKKDTKMNNLQLWEEANQIILSSGDLHHIFIEGFENENGHLKIITGS